MDTDALTTPIILNRSTGALIGRQKRDEIATIARQLGWEGEMWEAEGLDGVTKMVRKAQAGGQKRVIVCGGDGTIMEALGVLNGTETVLGIIPTGTGNLFARNLHIPFHVKQAVAVALGRNITTVDVGCANGRIFGVLCGIGWDAATVRNADRKLKDRIGAVAYFVAALRNLGYRQNIYSIAIDNQPPQQLAAQSVLIANLGNLTTVLQLFPNAHHQSGQLDVAVIQAENFMTWLSICFSAAIGRFTAHPNVLLFSGTKVTVRCLSQAQPIECDGNDYPAGKRLKVEVIPAAVRILTPPNRSTDH